MIQPLVSIARPIPPAVKRIAEAAIIATCSALAAWGVEEVKGVVNRRRARLESNRQAAKLTAVAAMPAGGDNSAAPTGKPGKEAE